MPYIEHNKLTIKYSGRIIDQLGIQMYQSPVAAIAEIVANAWDADSEKVKISLPTKLSERAQIIIKDDGLGMSFEECEKRYLNVGYCRRSNDPNEKSPEKSRPILGRKGIGKFAGFGIAECITVETKSKETGEKTVFKLDLNDLRGNEYVTQGHRIDVIEYQPKGFKKKHGTEIRLEALKLQRTPSEALFLRGMARRFLLHRRSADFEVIVNSKKLPKEEERAKIEFVFPDDYEDTNKPKGLISINDGWGKEDLSDGKQIRWRICFYKKPIDEEELRGVSVFTHGKLAQSPFFFNLTGGLGGQHGQEYISGQVEADYLDETNEDLIAPERQRIDFKREESKSLEEWGQERIKELFKIWRNRRAQKKVDMIAKKIAPFSVRLDKLQSHERKTIERAVKNLAKISALDDEEFTSLSESILSAWEGGRLKDLISHVANAESISSDELLNILAEEEVISSLNIAEGVKTKILTVGELKRLVDKEELENTIRDYIAEHPWLVAPDLQTFVKEKSLKKTLDKLANKYKLPTGKEGKRIDLVLKSADHLVVMEFMRPGLELNTDHLERYDLYFRAIKMNVVGGNTGGSFQRLTGYIIADSLAKDSVLLDKLKSMQRENMLALDWETLINKAIEQWQEFLEVLVSREPTDERLKALIGD